MNRNLLKTEKLSVSRGERRILKELSFELGEGRILGLLGENGCGKTTLLKAVCGILPYEGSCTLNGEEVALLSPKKRARQCSYVPQKSGLSVEVSVLDAVLMGFNPILGFMEVPGEAMIRIAVEKLKLLGLSEKAEENYLSLSEGQKQLCILARSLVSDAKLLLLDEPESALDIRARFRLMELVQKEAALGKSAVVALHDPQLALNFCDALLLLKDGEASLIADLKKTGLPELELQLRRLYGPLTLAVCRSGTGKNQTVMLLET